MNKIKNTRYQSLGYICEATKQWSFIDKESTTQLGHPVPIGPKYASKDELLADIERFATERGIQ